MRNKIIFAVSLVGILAGVAAAIFFSIKKPPLPPVFAPPANPYGEGIYTEGIVESAQASGVNSNMYPEVSGTVKEILVSEGQQVRTGDPLLRLDDSIQQATVNQQKAQAEAAKALLEELKAQPRKETFAVVAAQVVYAEATLKNAQDTADKDVTAYRMDPRSISKDALDSAVNAALAARANLEVAKRQRDLTKAGAWIYDIQNQERQLRALEQAYAASRALLDKYTLHAPRDGVVLSINTTAGNYASSLGGYNAYTQGTDPVIVLGSSSGSLHVRCYVDEILLPRLPSGSAMKAQMSVRGSNIKIPLDFVRVQPLVSPKIELSNQRQERVDVRVLPVIFKIRKPANVNLYPGELVDVYIGK